MATKKHWTQTPSGRARMREIQHELKRAKALKLSQEARREALENTGLPSHPSPSPLALDPELEEPALALLRIAADLIDRYPYITKRLIELYLRAKGGAS